MAIKKQKKETKKSTSKTKAEVPFAGHKTSLKAGEKAPSFTGRDQDGKTIQLSDYRGKKVVLYFYPKDDTPTCTKEACSLRDEYKLLGKNNLVVLGVSADNEKSHKKFATKFQLPFPLIADTDMKIIQAYDVWGKKMLFGRIYDGIVRTTFIIDERGKISHVLNDIDSANHAQQILGL